MITTTLPQTLETLVHLLSTQEKLNPSKVKKLVKKAAVSVEDLMEYAAFDHPVEDCYGRKLVYDGGSFEVMVMSWNPGDYSSIHNHGYTEWGVVQAFGSAQNNIYCIKEDRLHLAKKEILHPGDAIKVNHALIHQMGNPTSERFVSLHVYGSNARENEITADAKNFELEKNRISHTTGGAFFNLPEDEVYDFLPGIRPTKDAFMHYASLLLDYYNRQEDSDEMTDLKQSLLQQMEEWSMR